MQRHFTSAQEFAPPYTTQIVGAAFTRAILGLDAELRQQPEHMSGHDQSGSTLTMVAITPTDIVCANTGDSRSVLSRAGRAIDLSNDHKPFLEEEKTRIERAGGHVKFNRVNGDLAVSRALGDFAYKQVRERDGRAHVRTRAARRLAPGRARVRRRTRKRALEQTRVRVTTVSLTPRARRRARPRPRPRPRARSATICLRRYRPSRPRPS